MKLSAVRISYQDALKHIYSEREIDIIFKEAKNSILREQVQESSVTDLDISQEQIEKFSHALNELKDERPLQYVVSEAHFLGLRLFVDERVLIPRPETEELVAWILEVVRLNKGTDSQLKILDIGTGSGCMAIALKKALTTSIVHAIDISEGALNVAMKNAKENQTEITFKKMNTLDPAAMKALPTFDLIVSNPPYIAVTELKTMSNTVLNFEPHTALFVPDNDPLVFYKAIVLFAKEKLNEGGRLFFEVHENRATEVRDVLSASGFKSIEIRKDLQGKSRMLYAVN